MPDLRVIIGYLCAYCQVSQYPATERVDDGESREDEFAHRIEEGFGLVPKQMVASV
jgi:hypothetical protein